MHFCRCDELAAEIARNSLRARRGREGDQTPFTVMKPGGPTLLLRKALASLRIGGEDGYGMLSPTRQAHRAGRHGPSTNAAFSVLVVGALSLFSWAVVIEAGLALQSIF